MIGALLGAGVSGLSAMLQYQAQQQANAVNWKAVLETIRANREKEKLMKADRSDVYGNTLEYEPGKGFGFDLTPITQAILGGEQREQYLSHAVDAPRNRAAAERMDNRSQLADDEFEKKFNEYKYAPRRSENEYVSDATDTLLNARRKGLDESAAVLARQLLRTGNTSNLPALYKQAGDEYSKSLSEALLQGKRIGSSDYNAAESGRINRGNQELGFLANIANQTTTSPVKAGSYNSDLSQRADSAVSQLAQIMSSNQGAMSSALSNYAQGVGQSPNLNGIANALGGIDSSMAQQRAQSSNDKFRDREMDLKELAFQLKLQLLTPEQKQQLQHDPWAGMRTTG